MNNSNLQVRQQQHKDEMARTLRRLSRIGILIQTKEFILQHPEDCLQLAVALEYFAINLANSKMEAKSTPSLVDVANKYAANALKKFQHKTPDPKNDKGLTPRITTPEQLIQFAQKDKASLNATIYFGKIVESLSIAGLGNDRTELILKGAFHNYPEKMTQFFKMIEEIKKTKLQKGQVVKEIQQTNNTLSEPTTLGQDQNIVLLYEKDLSIILSQTFNESELFEIFKGIRLPTTMAFLEGTLPKNSNSNIHSFFRKQLPYFDPERAYKEATTPPVNELADNNLLKEIFKFV